MNSELIPVAFRVLSSQFQVLSSTLVDGDTLRLERVEHPAGVEQQAFNHRVPLKRGERVVETLDGAADGAPLPRDAELVVPILSGQAQLADDRLLAGVTKIPAQDSLHAGRGEQT